MKLKATKFTEFIPVKLEIICETQAEVNALYLLGNTSGNTRNSLIQHSSVKVSRPALDSVTNPLYEALVPYISKE
jgi:hypothetical protein